MSSPYPNLSPEGERLFDPPGQQIQPAIDKACANKDAEIARLKADVNSLNNLLRKVGWGQGEIDSSATIAEESEAKSELLEEAMTIFALYLNVPESRALQERWEKLKNAP